MSDKRYESFSYTANILGGDYPMSGLISRSDREGGWRIVAVPGSPSRDYMFKRFLSRAPADTEVVMARRAGYGDMNYGDGVQQPVFDFNDQVRALAPLFDKDDAKHTIIYGVSYGGALALKAALDYPHRIAGVLTVAMLVDEPRAYVRGMVRLGGLPGIRHVLPAYLNTARQEIAERRPQIRALFERLPSIKQPVTILHGNRDTLVPLSAARDLQNYFGDKDDIEFRMIKNGTHYLECERPNMLYEEIEKLKQRIH